MVHVKTYPIPPSRLIPNSPSLPVIHYPSLLLPQIQDPSFTPATLHDLFARNAWHTSWIVRYGPTQGSHYHSTTHEVMAVISGASATIRFGAADTSPDMQANTYGGACERESAVYVQARLGDVFVVPAGVAHKTFGPRPDRGGGLRQMVSLGGRREVEVGEGEWRMRLEGVKGEIEADGGFMMMGAYPEGCDWDWKEGGEHEGRFWEVWNVVLPERDPVLGESEEGLCGLWRREGNGKEGEGRSKL